MGKRSVMKWTPELSETIRAMHAAGVMPKDIGRKFGLTSNQVRGRLARMRGYQSVKDSDRRIKRPKPAPALRPRTNPLKDKGSWETKTILPYAQWKIWNQARRAANETRS